MQFELCSNGEAEVLHKILEVVLNIIWNVDSYGSPAVSRPVQLVVVVGTDAIIMRIPIRVYLFGNGNICRLLERTSL